MNFALILFLLVVVTGAAWVLERFRLAPARRRAADAAISEFERSAEATQLRAHGGEAAIAARASVLRSEAERQPWWLEYTAGLFPVILIVFAVRSFVVEPFKIPSGSMIPTLLVGDLILVNKYEYGVRLPVLNAKVLDVGEPQRGDVMVFRYPRDPSMDYIKRVVGIPGDEVTYQDKRLTINGRPVALKDAGEFYDPDRLSYARQYSETLGESEHKVLTEMEKPSFIAPVGDFPHRDRCQYTATRLTCTVPPGHYFVMGDNRDNSLDSRYWGFVPGENIVGRAFFIWMNFSDLKRIGRFQ